MPSRAALCLPYLPDGGGDRRVHPAGHAGAGHGRTLRVDGTVGRRGDGAQFFVVSENRRLLEVVADQAMRDPLTGLANRALFNDRLTHAMQLHHRENQPVAVL